MDIPAVLLFHWETLLIFLINNESTLSTYLLINWLIMSIILFSTKWLCCATTEVIHVSIVNCYSRRQSIVSEYKKLMCLQMSFITDLLFRISKEFYLIFETFRVFFSKNFNHQISNWTVRPFLEPWISWKSLTIYLLASGRPILWPIPTTTNSDMTIWLLSRTIVFYLFL